MKFRLIILVVLAVAFLSSGCARTQKAFDVLVNDDDQVASSATPEATSKSTTRNTQKKLTSPKTSPRRLADSSNRFRIPSDGMVWYVKGGRLKIIDSETAMIEASIGQAFKQLFLFNMTNKVALIATGTSAFKRIHTTKPTFYTRHKPSEIGIGRYTLQPERDRRYVWVVMRIGSNMADFYPYEKAVGYDYSKVSDDVYKIVLREELEAGEYTLTSTVGEKTVSYNFGIEVNAKRRASTSNTLVKQTQERLAGLGFDPGPADGIFGKKTGIALREFQKDHDIPATGLIDDRTIKALKISN